MQVGASSARNADGRSAFRPYAHADFNEYCRAYFSMTYLPSFVTLTIGACLAS